MGQNAGMRQFRTFDFNCEGLYKTVEFHEMRFGSWLQDNAEFWVLGLGFWVSGAGGSGWCCVGTAMGRDLWAGS